MNPAYREIQIEGREEEFSDSDPSLLAGLYRIKSDTAVFYDEVFKGFANVEFILVRGSEKVPVENTFFTDSGKSGDPLLVYQGYPYFIKEVNFFEHSKNISKRLHEKFNTRIISSEHNRYIPRSKFKSGKMLRSISSKRNPAQSVKQKLMDLSAEIDQSGIADEFYKNRRIKSLINKRRENFGPDYLNNQRHFDLWQKEWDDFRQKHQEKSEQDNLRKSGASDLDSIIRAYKARGPAQKQMLKDLQSGNKVPSSHDRFVRYMEKLADRFLVNSRVKEFADVTKGIRRLFNDLQDDGRIIVQDGYYAIQEKPSGTKSESLRGRKLAQYISRDRLQTNEEIDRPKQEWR